MTFKKQTKKYNSGFAIALAIESLESLAAELHVPFRAGVPAAAAAGSVTHRARSGWQLASASRMSAAPSSSSPAPTPTSALVSPNVDVPEAAAEAEAATAARAALAALAASNCVELILISSERAYCTSCAASELPARAAALLGDEGRLLAAADCFAATSRLFRGIGDVTQTVVHVADNERGCALQALNAAHSRPVSLQWASVKSM